jgi:hypothetical protein
MNELIEELYKQSFIEVQDENSFPCMTFSKQKFAELIVRECIDIAQDRANFPGYPPNDVNDIIDEIREHFGVEE